ncbi:hypothetical protein FJT64_016063 [Amphibalanus amphitrite]|uniref:Retrotransposon gag domain-containing protein n=1 Tax=Amphibalanus amphitrite TaxID=1232801 RepID=A0A6A4XE33_AMPAM|nr:hypothetical protein FJT64_016063 [Amphibalanus amphitrite]
MDFSRWLKGLEFYAEAMDITDDRRRTAVLLHLMGPDIQDVFDTLPEPTAAATAATSQYDTAVAKLRQYLQPTSNLMAERVTFHRTSMYAGESFDAYLARLRAVAGRCGFPAADLDRELRDRSVAGATPQIQERLLQTVGTKGDNFSLQDLQATARAYEQTQMLVTQFRNASLSTDGVGRSATALDERPEVDVVTSGPDQLNAVRPQRTADGNRNRQRRTVRCYRCDVSVRFRGRDHRLRLVVVDLPDDRRLLGRDWLRALDISVGGGETAVMDVTPERGTADLEAVCNRHKLQRYALQLAAFTYDVELRPSEDMHLADSLSRMAVPGGEVEPTDAEDDNSGGSYLLFMDGVAPVLTAKQLAAATRRDRVLSRVLTYVHSGWPGQVEQELAPFRQRRDELSTDLGCLLWGGRTVGRCTRHYRADPGES